MDQETTNAVVFMIFGLGFFLFCIWMIFNQENVKQRWKREIARDHRDDPKMRRSIRKEFHRM